MIWGFWVLIKYFVKSEETIKRALATRKIAGYLEVSG